MRTHAFVFTLIVATSGVLSGCVMPTVEGGANAHDRSNGGEQGERLPTGSMSVSSDGQYAIMQRNETTVLLDVANRTTREFPEQVQRFIFAKSGPRGFALFADGQTVVSYKLPNLDEEWRATPELSMEATLARLSGDDAHLVLGDAARILVLDASNGEMRGEIDVGSYPDQLTFVPDSARALVVGTVQWDDHLPSTRVVDVNLDTLDARSVEVPNCNAPLVVLPDASRAFLSPTFCEEGRSPGETATWTNPDPVSVIDLGEDGPTFVKNLPGFGPVSMDDDGSLAVAFLDVERMDETMFDDEEKIPSRTGDRYHIMTIDPDTLAYELTPVGDLLPRFAMTRNGGALLVDATVQHFRGKAKVEATLDSNGRVTVKVDVFGSVDSLFGLFDLETHEYAPFSGRAPLDRFVQMGDEERVFTLVTRWDGMGGDLYRIDIPSETTTSMNWSLRDIGLLSDGETMVLRERLPAVSVETDAGLDWYRRERYCFSKDGVTCLWDVEFEDSVPFMSGPNCTDYHDC